MAPARGILEIMKETTDFIRQEYDKTPELGVVLGSGLTDLSGMMQVEKELPYGLIPNFPVSTVDGHPGKLIFGTLEGKRIVVMSGRFHCYEGYTAAEVAFPVRVLGSIGIRALLISNAAGGVNPHFKVGDLMIIKDHIGLFTLNPLTGPNQDEWGPRFPDISEPYSKKIIELAKTLSLSLGIELKEGVYVGVRGPSFETRAEYRLIRGLGGDAVGMSTIQEVIAAAHIGLPVFALSVISNLGIRETDNTVTHQEVLREAAAAGPQLSAVFKALINEL